MIYNGNNLMAFIGEEAGAETNPRSIGFATNHQLSITQELKDIAHKDAGGGRWSVSSYGSVSWEITTDAFLGDTTSVGDANSKTEMKREGRGAVDMLKLFNARKPVYCVFGLEGDSKDFFNGTELQAPTGGWKPKTSYMVSGWAYISSLSISAPVNDYATWNITLTGTGPLTLAENETAWMSNQEETPVVPVVTVSKTTSKTANKD